jgi:uncharacterized protein YprB with RNaseH-like and TPR domain
MKMATIDGEMTNLDANFGRVLCFCIKPLDGRVITLKEGQYKKRFPGDDKSLVEAIAQKLEKFDLWIGWYTQRFDIPFIQTRLVINGSPPLQKRFHIDLWFQSRYKLKLHSNRLEAVADSLDVPHKKTKLLPDIWRRAQAGDKTALDYIVKHCQEDVRTLEDVYNRLHKYIDTIKKR